VNILHVIPRFIGGGPERNLLAVAAAWRDAGLATCHRVVALEPPLSAPLVLRARRLGMQVSARPAHDDLLAAVAAADVVELCFWNHPAVFDLLRQELPPMRLLLTAQVAGTSRPQVLTADLGDFADAAVFTADASRQTALGQTAGRLGTPLETIPALADMTRLEGFVPRPHDGIRVGYLGLVEPTKMHPRFAELSAAVAAPDVTFDVFGDGTWGDELRRRFAELGAAGRLRLHGHAEDLRAALAPIDIFGYPLATDTYASSDKTLQEAMWVGIPPVVLGGTGVASLVGHDRTGLVCESEADYPRAIERLAADTALRQRLGTAARAHARLAFDPARNAARLRSLVETLAAMPKRQRPPLAGRDLSGAGRFVASLGELAGEFAVSLAGSAAHPRDAVRAADAAIAAATDVLARGEGGIIHYRNAYLGDPHLRLWAGLVARARGGPEAGAADLAAAVAGGIEAWRVPGAGT
jgi:glycosyltransferase involved in cell wall biosynthesis